MTARRYRCELRDGDIAKAGLFAIGDYVGLASTILADVLPHEGMLPVSWVSFCVHPARRATFWARVGRFVRVRSMWSVVFGC